MLEVSERGGEHDARWSRPYPTADAAHQAGQDAQDRAHGLTAEPTPAAAIRESQASADIWADREMAGRAARERDRDLQGEAAAPTQRRGMRHAAE